jgi:AcrR family transcriptional regulator
MSPHPFSAATPETTAVMDSSVDPVGPSRPSAAERILQATARTIAVRGAAALTMSEVAETAGVSKGLIHYHFHDKETLLARVVEWMTREVIDRERLALERSSARSAIDDLWRWLNDELEHGHLRVLVELSEWREELVRREIQVSAGARRTAAVASTARLFQLLGLKPRIPEELIAEAVLAFRDGLAVAAARDHESNPRAAFDVFWLALLSLAD